MKAKLIISDKEFEIEILDPELQKLIMPPEKKTGYERVEDGGLYTYIDACGRIVSGNLDKRGYLPNDCYDVANYYSDSTVAENNARADKLMWQLRRFAVEHRKKELDFCNRRDLSFIGWAIDAKTLEVLSVGWAKTFGSIVFDSSEAAHLAIETFHDELVWYFTEYKDSL